MEPPNRKLIFSDHKWNMDAQEKYMQTQERDVHSL